MADDDDDDSFGDFTFASNSSSQIPITTTTTTTVDDDWGDFNSFQTITTTDHNLKSPQSHTEPKRESIKGALPLSLFGDDDDDVEENNDNVKHFSFFSNNDKSKSNKKLEINDLIANLYGPSQQQQDKDISKVLDNGNQLDPVLKKSVSLSSFSFNAAAAAAENRGSGDEGAWEFINAFSDRKDKDNKERFEKTLSQVNVQNGLNGQVDLFAASKDGAFVESHERNGVFDSKAFTSFQNGFTTYLNADFKGTGNELNSNPNVEADSDDFDDTFGEFETAAMEQPATKKERFDPLGSQDANLFPFPNGIHSGSHKEDNGFDFSQISVVQNSVASDTFSQTELKETKDTSDSLTRGGDTNDENFGKFETTFPASGSKLEVTEERFNPLGSQDANLFPFPNGIYSGSHKDNNGFDFSQISVVQNSVASDTFSQTELKESKDTSDSLTRGGDTNDENFGKFETTFPASGSKLEGYEASSKNYKNPVPLSFFGIEEDSQEDTSLNLEHELFKSSTQKNHLRNQSSSLSINDILSDLYSQAQPMSSSGQEDLPHSTGKESVSNLVDDDNFDDGSWEFKDASIQSRVENLNSSFKAKLENFKDFYSSLRDDLAVLARSHLHGLKKAESSATFAGEELKVAGLDKEIQEALVELHQKDIILTETDLYDYSEQVISFKQYSQTLSEPDFQLLESEYHILRRLSLAESDLRTTIDLINHSSTVLKVLTLAPKGEPAEYLSIWFKVISVCSQELKHGTWILKQSLEKNVRSELLSEQQGKLFILSLGEIYRAVVILGAAVKFYKPWILLSGASLKEIYALLEECHSLWSTSGLEEAIPAESCLEAIGHIRNLDEVAIANKVLSQEESLCVLSLLSPGVVPDMKMVIWNGDKYFVSLANLWANLISPNPPNVTLHVG